MANDFTSNPWTIDTAYVGPIAAGHITESDLVYISSIVWSDQAAQGDQVVVKDKNGKTIMDAKTNAPNTPIILANPKWVRGFRVPTLTSGKLEVFISR